MAYEPCRYYWAAAVLNAIGSNSNTIVIIASVLFGSLLHGAKATWRIEQRIYFWGSLNNHHYSLFTISAKHMVIYTLRNSDTISVVPGNLSRVNESARPARLGQGLHHKTHQAHNSIATCRCQEGSKRADRSKDRQKKMTRSKNPASYLWCDESNTTNQEIISHHTNLNKFS